jgi:hypothetical protein
VTLCDVLELAVPLAPANEAVAVPALTPQEFLFSTLLDGPQPAKAVERVAREQHGWRAKVLWKARRELRVKAIRSGFGPGGCWIWALPEEATAEADLFSSGRMAQLYRGLSKVAVRRRIRVLGAEKPARRTPAVAAGLLPVVS